MEALVGSRLVKRLALPIAVAGLAVVAIWGSRGAATLLLMTLTAWVPVSLAAVGEVLNQQGGVFNIGIEGIMLFGSFFGVFSADLLGSWVAGLGGGALGGGLLALLFGVAVTYGRANQVIAGLGLNFVALGAVAFFIYESWSDYLFHRLTDALRAPVILTPWGPFRWMVPVTIVVTLLLVGIMRHTRFGLRLKAVGYNALVADMSGIDVYRVRLQATVSGGILAGLAGAYMSVDWIGLTSLDLIAGRGFIALACVVFSALNPWRALGAAAVFSFFNAAGLWLQVVPWARGFMGRGGNFFFLMLPYLAVLALLIAAPGRERFPREVGRPYVRA